MYEMEAAIFSLSHAQLSPNLIEDGFYFGKVVIVALMMSWCSIASVKFSFLVLFRKLIDCMCHRPRT